MHYSIFLHYRIRILKEIRKKISISSGSRLTQKEQRKIDALRAEDLPPIINQPDIRLPKELDWSKII